MKPVRKNTASLAAALAIALLTLPVAPAASAADVPVKQASAPCSGNPCGGKRKCPKTDSDNPCAGAKCKKNNDNPCAGKSK
jgi:hypothetical protein